MLVMVQGGTFNEPYCRGPIGRNSTKWKIEIPKNNNLILTTSAFPRLQINFEKLPSHHTSHKCMYKNTCKGLANPHSLSTARK